MLLAASVGSVEFRYLVLVDLKDFSAGTSSNLFQIARRHPPLLRRRLDLWHPLLVGAGEWGTGCCSTAIAVNKQWLDFLQKRLKADLEMPQRFISCSSPYEAWSGACGISAKNHHRLSERTHRTCQARRRQTPDERRMKVCGAGTRYHPVFRPAAHRL